MAKSLLSCRRPFLPVSRFPVSVVLVLGLFPFLVSPAWGMPKYIDLVTMVQKAEVIAVARVAGKWNRVGSVELELTRIIKGNIKPGKHRVLYDDHPRIEEGVGEFVAFFGKHLCWRFVAQPLSHKKLAANSVLFVSGFYNWNAYQVSPPWVSLAQLETLVQKGTLTYVFQGPLSFPPPDREELEVEVKYDVVADRAVVRLLREGKE